jgi:CRISPR-associated protein Csb1
MSETRDDQFDSWLQDDGPAALVFHRRLLPVEGKDAWIFPPTFAQSESGDDEEEGRGGDYQIDPLPDDPRHNVCLIDSIGSQANRMEPVFKREPYSSLVPKRVVTMTNGDTVDLLDVGHRAADAAVRFSTELGPQVWDAFNSIKRERDYSALVSLAPTSLVFGVWDSRGTGVKVQRIVKSVIRAYNVTKTKRSATYQAAYEYVDNGLIDPSFDKGTGKNNPLSQEGFKYSLATGTHGGVQVKGEIRQEAMVNLVALRTLADAINLKRYLLGLALVALSFRDQTSFNLREGCLLKAATPEDFDGKWKSVNFDGTEADVDLTHLQACEYAQLAVQNVPLKAVKPSQFDRATVEAWLKIEKKKRKTLAKKKYPAQAVVDEALAATKKNKKKGVQGDKGEAAK